MLGRRVTVVLSNARLYRPATTFQQDLPLRILLSQPRRLYATPGRPKSVVGEPSRPVKRAVKRSAAKATSDDSPAKQKVESKKKAAAKKPAKKAAAKPKPAKKVLTDEQKARKAAKTEKDNIKALKQLALDPPAATTLSAYAVFMKDKTQSPLENSDHTQHGVQEKFTSRSKDVSAKWRSLSAADLEHYNHLANTVNQERRAALKQWVESHDANTIMEANRARAALRLRLEKDRKANKFTKWPDIADERSVRRPASPYALFTGNRWASGDMKSISIPEAAKLISTEWKELDAEEKEKYQRLQRQDHDRYVKEYLSIYGHPPPTAANGHQQTVAAAA